MLPDWTLLVPFLAASAVLILTPGPDTLYVAARSVGQGRVAGLIAAAGITAGLVVHIAAAALGLAGLFRLVPIAFDVVRYLGVVYLLYLAWHAFADTTEADDATAAPTRLSPARIFRQAAVTNILNPKVALFFVAFLPPFADPARGSVALQLASLGALFIAMGLVYLVALAILAGQVGDRLRTNPRARRVQRWFQGSVLGAMALWLAWPERR